MIILDEHTISGRLNIAFPIITDSQLAMIQYYYQKALKKEESPQ